MKMPNIYDVMTVYILCTAPHSNVIGCVFCCVSLASNKWTKTRHLIELKRKCIYPAGDDAMKRYKIKLNSHYSASGQNLQAFETIFI